MQLQRGLLHAAAASPTTDLMAEVVVLLTLCDKGLLLQAAHMTDEVWPNVGLLLAGLA